MSDLERGAKGSESNHADIQLIRVHEIVRLMGLSRATLNRLVRAGNFPQAVRITQRVVAWKKRDIVEWLASRPDA